jgi:tetratricopeptide (TPR) repeat protein
MATEALRNGNLPPRFHYLKKTFSNPQQFAEVRLRQFMPSRLFYTAFFHCTLVVLSVLICYSNTLDSSWHFDDAPNIIKNDNIHVQNLSWSELKNVIYHPLNNKISRPVAFFSFALNYWAAKFDTTGYHITNIVIHCVTAVCIYLVFLKTLQVYFRERNSPFVSFTLSGIALLGVMFWAVHPVQTQAVTYIVQRMASMAAMFYMMAFYCYLRSRLASGGIRKLIFFFLAFLCWLLAVGTKENAVLLPLALVGYEIALFRFPFAKYKKSLAIIGICATAVALVLFSLKWGGIYQQYSFRPFTLWQRLLTEPLILTRYLFLIFCPLSDFLAIESDIIAAKGIFDPPATVTAIVFITSLVLCSVVWLKKLPIALYAVFFFFANHLVESTVIPLELSFDHRNYLPSIFLYLALAYYLVRAMNYYQTRKRAFLYGLLSFTITFYVASEGNATYLRNDIYRNEITLLTDAVEKSPENIRGMISLGVSYMKLRKYDKALEYYKMAEERYRRYPGRYQANWAGLLYYNAGVLATRKAEEKKAIELFYKSIFYYPFDLHCHFNLGVLLFKNGDLDNAEKALNNALAIQKELGGDYPQTYNVYGRILYAQNKLDVAAEIFQKGLESSEMKELKLNLIATCIQKREMVRARQLLYKLPRDNNDIAYLLYRSLLFDDNERERSLSRVASLLVAKKVDFNNWLEETRNNKFPGIIYPDISTLEEEIVNLHSKLILESRVKLEEKKQVANGCS